jgi:hypothetical protein
MWSAGAVRQRTSYHPLSTMKIPVVLVALACVLASPVYSQRRDDRLNVHLVRMRVPSPLRAHCPLAPEP